MAMVKKKKDGGNGGTGGGKGKEKWLARIHLKICNKKQIKVVSSKFSFFIFSRGGLGEEKDVKNFLEEIFFTSLLILTSSLLLISRKKRKKGFIKKKIIKIACSTGIKKKNRSAPFRRSLDAKTSAIFLFIFYLSHQQFVNNLNNRIFYFFSGEKKKTGETF